MGWADCGNDSKGRPIGYAFTATCDHPGCNAKIHRGLSYACGGMHGETEYGCERYFCPDHLTPVETVTSECISVCSECLKLLIDERALSAEELEDYAAALREETEEE